MPRRVVFHEFGGVEGLRVEEAAPLQAGPGQVRVRVRYAGLNPSDLKILAGTFFIVPDLPSGFGNDFSGVVDQIGEGVTGPQVGDPVFGGRRLAAEADHLLASPSQLHRVPVGLGLDVAAGLQIAATTALAGIRAVAPVEGETVLVSGAAGGVGVLAAQLARAAGARVIGTASESNHGFLRSLGIIPVAYGEGVWDRIRELAPAGVSAALSTRGIDEVRGLIALGVPPERIDAVAAGAAAGELGVHTDGSAAAWPDDLDRMARALAEGRLVLPIDSVYSLDSVQAAYRRLAAGHLRGKILLRTADVRGAADLL
ncbi:NADP-dependent oxidoreductase [Acidipropionibacterium jensenii]|uniref:NADP-dependent oxidoreductase n=1 Tax=Acidipropionibacterium jensenii TaxID=1749 RepID=UPI00110B0CA7|nr:NADP-dependent oxidoreductase [Acidipropionibacterium jensenii]QCV87481.1 NADP-dependent oxidoreductase [Acidipropionibacterium jensenii]